MPGQLAAAMLAELQRLDCSAFPFLELYLPSPLTTRRYASYGVSSASLGTMAGKVVNWGIIRRQVSDRDNSLVYSDTDVTIEDTDGSFVSALETLQQTMRGARATIKLGSDRVAAASWATVFDGYVDKWSMKSALVWNLELHPNDRPLENPVPKTPFLAGDFPNVGDKTLYGEHPSIIYGIHDSRGSSDAGMIPCPYVDTIAFRYMVCLGWAKDVPRVYKDGVLTSASNYTITHPAINGRQYTLIDFTADQTDGVITADVEGYEATGDGSGALLTGVNCLKHFLVNFVYNDYQSGNWGADGTAPVNTTAFSTVQTYLTDLGWEKVSARYGGESQVKAVEVINEFCRSLQLYVFPTRAGQIAVGKDDHRSTTLWYDQPQWIRYDKDEKGEDGSLQIDYDKDSLIDRLSVHYIYNAAEGKYVQTIEVRDLSSTEQATDNLDLPWSNASLA